MNNMKKALENAMEKDIGRYEDCAEHEFSEKFEREMQRLSGHGAQKKRPKLRIGRIIAAAAAAIALFAVGTFAGAVSSGFSVTQTTRLGLPAKLFTATDTENCPKTIETVYTLDGFPKELLSVSGTDKLVASKYFPGPLEGYINDERYMGKVIHLYQETKENFEFQYTDMDYVTYKTLTVNGGQAYFITRERFYGMDAYLFWESEDYIFTLAGGFSEERAVELASSLVVYDGEIPYNGVREEW